MEYYRPNVTGGMTQTNLCDTNNMILNSATDSYASNYWNIPYTDGLSPMKQIEGKNNKIIVTRNNWRCFLKFTVNLKQSIKEDF